MSVNIIHMLYTKKAVKEISAQLTDVFQTMNKWLINYKAEKEKAKEENLRAIEENSKTRVELNEEMFYLSSLLSQINAEIDR